MGPPVLKGRGRIRSSWSYSLSSHLPHAVGAALCLQVHVGVEVHVVDDHRVRAVQVDSQRPRPRRDQEERHRAIWAVKVVDQTVPLARGGVTVQPVEKGVPPPRPGHDAVQEVLQNVQKARPLGEDESAVVVFAQRWQQALQHL
eukprot:4828649-Pyramimonas_sp.AAC.1